MTDPSVAPLHQDDKVETGSVTVGAASIAYTVRRSKRRRRTLEVRVDHNRDVLVVVPFRASAAEIADFVRRHAGWIQRKMAEVAERPERKPPASGDAIPYLGRDLSLLVELANAGRVRARVADSNLTLVIPRGLDPDQHQRAVAQGLQDWYRSQAAELLGKSVNRLSPLAGQEPKQVLIRNQRRRWGSCGADGTLRFNWRLVQLDPSLIDYVVVHELAHLRVRNHSVRFWSEVGRVQPDYRERRRALNAAGALVVL